MCGVADKFVNHKNYYEVMMNWYCKLKASVALSMIVLNLVIVSNDDITISSTARINESSTVRATDHADILY